MKMFIVMYTSRVAYFKNILANCFLFFKINLNSHVIPLFQVSLLRHFCQAAEDGFSGTIHPIGIVVASFSELINLSQAALKCRKEIFSIENKIDISFEINYVIILNIYRIVMKLSTSL